MRCLLDFHLQCVALSATCLNLKTGTREEEGGGRERGRGRGMGEKERLKTDLPWDSDWNCIQSIDLLGEK